MEAYSDAGGNVIDTASNYRGGASEEIVGELLVGRRDRFVLSTKYTVTRDPADPNAAGNHRKNLVLTLERSLQRLRTDYIDFYWVHIWDRATPIEATIRALDDAVRSGKVLHVGISDTPAWVVARGMMVAEWRGWTPYVDQLVDNLGALDVQLTPDHLARLEQSTGFQRGFPLDFIEDTSGWAFGAADMTASTRSGPGK